MTTEFVSPCCLRRNTTNARREICCKSWTRTMGLSIPVIYSVSNYTKKGLWKFSHRNRVSLIMRLTLQSLQFYGDSQAVAVASSWKWRDFCDTERVYSEPVTISLNSALYTASPRCDSYSGSHKKEHHRKCMKVRVKLCNLRCVNICFSHEKLLSSFLDFGLPNETAIPIFLWEIENERETSYQSIDASPSILTSHEVRQWLLFFFIPSDA
jgi:hypothetical protein